MSWGTKDFSKPNKKLARVGLVQGIIDTKESEVVVHEHYPVKVSKANANIENGATKTEGQCRVVRMSLEQRLSAGVPIPHLIHPWHVKHAADSYTEFSIDATQKT